MLNWWYIDWPLGCKGLNICYRNQSVNVVSGTCSCLSSDKYVTQIQWGLSVQFLNVKLVVHIGTTEFERFFILVIKNQSVEVESGTSPSLNSEKYKIYKYIVGTAYSFWMLNFWYIEWPLGCNELFPCYKNHQFMQ
jgi:hypothetical protein